MKVKYKEQIGGHTVVRFLADAAVDLEETKAAGGTIRIAGLTDEQKADEKRSKLHALAREANNKAQDAALLGEDFDPLAWLQPRREEIELLYA